MWRSRSVSGNGMPSGPVMSRPCAQCSASRVVANVVGLSGAAAQGAVARDRRRGARRPRPAVPSATARTPPPASARSRADAALHRARRSCSALGPSSASLRGDPSAKPLPACAGHHHSLRSGPGATPRRRPTNPRRPTATPTPRRRARRGSLRGDPARRRGRRRSRGYPSRSRSCGASQSAIGTGGHDARGADAGAGAEGATLDVVEVGGLTERRPLVEVAGVAPEVRVVDEPPEVEAAERARRRRRSGRG